MVRLKKGADGEVLYEKGEALEFDPNLKLVSPEFSSILKGALKQFCGSSKGLEIWSAPKLDRARLHHIKVPKVAPAGLPGAVYWGLQREDAFVEDETVVDFQVEEGGEASEISDVTGALVERECVEDLQKAFSQAGYPLTGIGLPLLAFRNLVKLQAHEAPVLICQLGQLSTSVSVLLEGRLVFTRSIPLGLESLTEVLVNEPESKLVQREACEIILNLGFEEAKFSLDECSVHEKAFTLVRPVLERLVRQIERTIEYYQSNFETEPIRSIFIGGEIAGRGRLFDFISEKLSPEVIAIDPFEMPLLEGGSSAPSENVERVGYGLAFGLALESNQKGINLANTYKERQSEGKHNKVATIASILLILLAVAATCFFSILRGQLSDLKKERRDFKKELAALGPRLSEATITAANEDVRLLGEQRRAATKRYEGLALLSEITRLTPEDISLLHISAAIGSGASFSPPPTVTVKSESDDVSADRQGTLIIRGGVAGVRASLETSLTIYIARLDQSNLFQSIEVEATEIIQCSGELHLTFTLLIETVPAIEDIPKK